MRIGEGRLLLFKKVQSENIRKEHLVIIQREQNQGNLKISSKAFDVRETLKVIALSPIGH